MKKLLLSVFAVIACMSIYGQELQIYAPVSPNAASLGKIDFSTVSTNLRTTNISIPLYTISQDDVNNLTFSLNQFN